MRRNFLKSAAAAGMGLAGASAFGQQSAAPAAVGLHGKSSDVYVMNVMVSGVEYWFPVYEMMKQLGRELGVKTRYSGTPEYDVNKQLASFEQELARKPAGILLHPMNPDPFIEPINRAVAMGIPVVTFAADSPNSKRSSFITSDNDREGSQAADAIAKAAPEAFGKPPAIGVVPDSFACRKNHCVDRANDCGVLRQFVQQRDDRLFAGMCDVDPDEALLLGRVQQLRQGFDAYAELRQVDQLIGADDACRAGFTFVEVWRTRSLNACADQTDQP